jgi:membrane-associated phospholipid phosphatase/VanZ family protein
MILGSLATPIVLIVFSLRKLASQWRWSPAKVGKTRWFIAELDLGLLATLAMTFVATLVLQHMVGRARPEPTTWLAPPLTPSFPSGHASLLFGALTWMVLTRYRRAFLVGGLLVALWGAASRVVAGHHHLSDVLAGTLVGIAVALFAFFCRRAFFCERSSRLQWIGAALLTVQATIVGLTVVLAYLGLLPSIAASVSDKFFHALLFGLLAFCVDLTMGFRDLSWRRLRLPIAVLIVLIPAAIEEAFQTMSPRRNADPLDLLADLVGIALFVLLSRALFARRWRHHDQS